MNIGNIKIGVADIEPTTEDLTVTPSINEQVIVPPTATYYKKVTVEGVTSDIDSNIKPENIKDGVDILGVEGTGILANETTLNVQPSTESQSFTPEDPYTGYDEVNISAVTHEIDENITPSNIKDGVEILGVTGEVIESNETTANVTPSTSSQQITPPTGYTGFNEVNVAPVTSSIDSDIQASNIKKDVDILGVIGTVIESNETTVNVTPSTSSQQLTPSSPYTGFDEVNVAPVTSSIDSNIQAGNIKKNVTILGTTGSYEGEPINLQNKSETITENKTTIITADSGYDGLGQVEVITNVSGSDYKMKDLSYLFYNGARTSNVADVLTLCDSKPTDIRSMFQGSGLTSITFPNLDTSDITDMSNLFSGHGNTITSIDITNLNTNSATNMSYMFSSLGTTASVPITVTGLNSLNTSNATDMSYMFSASRKFTSLDISNWNTKKVINMSYMFSNCFNITQLTLGNNFRWDACTNASYVFSGCSNLPSLDLKGVELKSGLNISGMFSGTQKLATLEIDDFDFTGITNYTQLFYNCGTGNQTPTKVYVKDATAQSWILALTGSARPSSWTTANVIIAGSADDDR